MNWGAMGRLREEEGRRERRKLGETRGNHRGDSRRQRERRLGKEAESQRYTNWGSGGSNGL